MFAARHWYLRRSSSAHATPTAKPSTSAKASAQLAPLPGM